MIGLLTALSALALYGSVILWLRHRATVTKRGQGFSGANHWPAHPTLRRLWLLWLGFLAVFAPLIYQQDDMEVWTGAIANLLHGLPLPDGYVYLPAFAQFQAALVWPLHWLNLDSRLVLVWLVHWTVLAAYAACAPLLKELAADEPELAPLGIVLAPVTVFYLFFGTNHVVMAFLLLAALWALKREHPFWAGFLAGAACYKLLLVPTVLVLAGILWRQRGWKAVRLFTLGGAAFLAINLPYYLADPQAFTRLLANQGNIGGHAAQMDWFHFLYIFSRVWPGFEAHYLQGRLWLILTLLVAGLSLWLFLRRRINTLQALALSYTGVALFSPEPFRLEPLAALLWLDAISRRDRTTQTALAFTLLVHAAAWFDLAYFRMLSPDPQAPWWLWGARGFILGEALIFTLLVALQKKNRRASLFLDDKPALAVNLAENF